MFISALTQNMSKNPMQQETFILLWDLTARALRHHQRNAYLLK
jgi:hypothetical protein